MYFSFEIPLESHKQKTRKNLNISSIDFKHSLIAIYI